MKASLTLREDPQNPIIKAKIPLSIFGLPFCSAIQAGDYNDLCISFSTAFCSGPQLKFCYRPNDLCRQFGVILRTGAGDLGSPSGSPISMSAEFSFTGNNCRPRFLLHLKPRSGDISVRRSVESPALCFSSQSRNHEPMPTRNGVVAGEKLNWSWNQLFSNAYRLVSDGEVCATTSVPIKRAAVKLGWSMKFPPPIMEAEGGGSGSIAETLFNEMPHLVLRKIAIERVAEDEREKWKKRGKSESGAESRLGLKRELKLLKSKNNLARNQKIEDENWKNLRDRREESANKIIKISDTVI